MRSPSKTKYRKAQKGRRRKKGMASSRTKLSFGGFGLRSLETLWITSRQIEAARRTIIHGFKRKGKLWARIFSDKPVTAKSAETPMGSGKGAVDHYVAPIKKGTIIFEVTGVDEAMAREILRQASHKLPVKTQFIKEFV